MSFKEQNIDQAHEDVVEHVEERGSNQVDEAVGVIAEKVKTIIVGFIVIAVGKSKDDLQVSLRIEYIKSGY